MIAYLNIIFEFATVSRVIIEGFRVIRLPIFATLQTMFKSKLEVTLDFYNRTTSNMLTQVPIPRTAGTGTIPYTNIGEINNKGMDINATWKDNIGQLRYTVVAFN